MRPGFPMFAIIALVILVACGLQGAGCGDDDTLSLVVIPSQSYKGHENDIDSNNLVRVYPGLVGTRLDDCQTCHSAGTVQMEKRGEVTTVQLNPCSYCHLIPYPDDAVLEGAPAGYAATLNAYGLDYKEAGRSTDAIRDITDLDSDGDDYTNAREITDLRYPGDPDSRPGQLIAPCKTYDLTTLASLPYQEQFLLMNSHKQEFDTYATYGGVKIADLLAAAGAELTDSTSVTFIAPDGYAKDFEIGRISEQFPPGLYYANLDPGSFSNAGQGFVQYPPEDQMPANLVDGGEIPGEQWMIVAHRRDGGQLDPSYLDAVSGKLNGEGPYRLIVPQGCYGSPGAPDRGSKYSPSEFSEDGYDYDDEKDHNAGLCVRGLVAVRVNPMPEGYEEFDWKNGGYSLLEKSQIIVYGAGITAD